MKKILFVIGSANIGGAETGLMEIVNELHNDYEVDICFYNRVGQLLEKIPDNVGTYEICNENRNKVYKKIIQYLYYHGSKLLYKHVIKKKYDVEIAFIEGAPAVFISNSFNKKSKKIASIRVDLSKHNIDVENRVHNKNKAYSILSKAYSKIDTVFGVSNTTTKSFAQKFPEYSGKLYTINTFFDKDKYMKLAKEKFKYKNTKAINLVSVGRCSEQKGYDRLVEVADKLRRDKVNFVWHIVGRYNNNYADNLKNEIEKRKLQEYIIFEGETSNPYKYIFNSYILISTSYYEGYPRVVNEAIALEIPVVAPDISGVKESISGKYGICTKDNTQSIYLGVKELITNKDKYAKIKKELKNKKYDKNIFYDKIKLMIEE